MLGSYGSSQTGDSGLTIPCWILTCDFSEGRILLFSRLLNLFVKYYILIMRDLKGSVSKVKQ